MHLVIDFPSPYHYLRYMYTDKDFERLFNDYQELKNALGQMNKHRFADQFLTNEEFCSLLDISEKTAKRWRESQTIPYAQLGKRIYYRLSDIQKLFEKEFKKTDLLQRKKAMVRKNFITDPKCNGWDLTTA